MPPPWWRHPHLAPPVGLEPTTPWLTVRCSTDWAKEEYICWRYLSSRSVTQQVLSAKVCLTSVFGMGTGGPTPQSTPTIYALVYRAFILYHTDFLLSRRNFGDPYRIRTDVNGVRGRCLNHLTNGPHLCATLQTPMAYEFNGAPSGTRTRDLLIKSQPLYQLS